MAVTNDFPLYRNVLWLSIFLNGSIIQETLVPYQWNVDWIDEKLSEMIQVLNSKKLPEVNPSCENCAYANQRAMIEARN